MDADTEEVCTALEQAREGHLGKVSLACPCAQRGKKMLLAASFSFRAFGRNRKPQIPKLQHT